MTEIDRAVTADPPPPRRRGFRRRYIPMLLIGAIGLTGWLERRTILTRVIHDRLAAARLPLRYTISDLGLGRQRFTGLVVGDPARPDLTADWVETHTRIGLRGPYLAAVSAGHVRLRGRLTDGRLSLGDLDRLLSSRATGGEGPTLPALRLSVQEAQLRLATPAGPVAVALSGSGRLDRDFAGVAAIVAPRLAAAGCSAADLRATLSVAVLGEDAQGGQRVRLSGPARLGAGACADTRLAGLRTDLTTMLTLGREPQAAVEARVATGAIDRPDGRAAGVEGTVALALTPADGGRVAGRIALTARRTELAGTRIAGVTADGGIAAARGALRFDGDVRVDDLDARRWWPGLPAAAGTPVAPLLAALDRAGSAAARGVSGEAQLNVSMDGEVVALLRRARLRADSGAFAVIDARDSSLNAIEWRPGRPPAIDANLATGGGGLPRVRASVARTGAGRPIRIAATVAPFAADGARLVLAPVTGTLAANGAARLATRVTLSGPLGDGRVEEATMPLDLQRSADGAIAIGAACTPLSLRALSVSGLTLDPARLTLCPAGGALVRIDRRGGIAGGATIPASAVAGRLGSTPLAVTATGGSLGLAGPGFALTGVSARLGAPDRVTRIEAERLDGTIAGGGVAGTFAGAGGQIANVPLILSAGDGPWRFARGTLSLTGAARVADAGVPARFNPMQARDLALTLTGGTIAVTGTLYEPTTGTAVADVRIRHRLPTGVGRADLSIAGLTFAKGFQPELLTPITFGVIADVKGTIDGTAQIDWSPQGVTSTGDFGTRPGGPGIDLAAAFGPAQGIAGRVRFDDLLGLHTPPGQVATVRSVNPGIAVENGTVRYQLLGGTQVQVEGAEWPFAGGQLTLDPTLLDFAAQRARRLTFHVAGARADQFLLQFDFQNLDATGTFDGVLPMIFDDSGGRIEGGRMTVREGGGTIAYVGELSQKQLGVWGNLAFQALRSLRYRRLVVTMDGPLAGEMVTGVRFDGVSQGQGAKSNFLIRRLQRLPFVFNVRIRAPFRSLIDSAASFYDPRRLIQRNLPALLEEQNRRTSAPQPAPATPAIQPHASETMR